MTWAVEVYATYKKVRIIRQLLSRDKEEVMAENNVRKKKKRKNTTTGLVLLVLVLTVIILGIILIIVNKLDKNNKNNNKVSLKTSKIEYEADGSDFKISPSDVLNGPSDKVSTAVIDSTSVNAKNVGEYEIKVTCDGNTYTVTVSVKDTKKPVIDVANTTQKVPAGQELEAAKVITNITDATECKTGFVMADELDDVAGKIKSTVSFNEKGTYTVYAAAVDSAGNYSTLPVTVEVTEAVKVDYLNSGAKVKVDANTDFSKIDNKTIPFGFSNEDRDENNRPNGCNYYKTKYGKYAVDFIQPNSEYVFLTFDEGYEYGNTPEILDTLKEKNVKAVFFVTLPFAKSEPKLIQRMIDEGHVIGNHTVTHPSAGLQSLSVEDQIKEIKDVHDYMLENYNYEMYLFRFPTGAFSEQSLAIVQSLGYRSVFWSFAHRDWVVDDQPDVGESLQKALNQAHGGEIFLLHGVSTTDTKMLGDLIDGLRAKGFKFGYYAKTN